MGEFCVDPLAVCQIGAQEGDPPDQHAGVGDGHLRGLAPPAADQGDVGLKRTALQAEAPGPEVRLQGQGQVLQGRVPPDAGPPQVAEVSRRTAYRQRKRAAGDSVKSGAGLVEAVCLPQEGQGEVKILPPGEGAGSPAGERSLSPGGAGPPGR